MSPVNSEFPQQLIESWRDVYDLDEQDIDLAQKLWQEKVIEGGWSPDLIISRLEDNLKERNQRVQVFNDEICEFVKQHYPLDAAFLQALAQKRVELAEKFGTKSGKLSDRFTDTTPIVQCRQDDLQQYEAKVCELAQARQSFQFSPDDRASLKDRQQELDIAEGIADRIEQDLINNERQAFRYEATKIFQKNQPPDPEAINRLRLKHCLGESQTQDILQDLQQRFPSPAPPPPKPSIPPLPDPQPSPVNPEPVNPDPLPQAKPPLWMYSAVVASLVVTGLAALGLTRLPQFSPQVAAPNSPSPESAIPFLPSQFGTAASKVLDQIDQSWVAEVKALFARPDLTNQQIIDGIKRLSQVRAEGHRQEAQALTGTGCTKLQATVMAQFNAGKFSDAGELVKQATPCTQLQTAWQKSADRWQQNTKALAEAERKLTAKDYAGAIAAAEQVSGNEFQLKVAGSIVAKVQAERPPVSISSPTVTDPVRENISNPVPENISNPVPENISNPVPENRVDPPVFVNPPSPAPAPAPPLCMPGAGVEC